MALSKSNINEHNLGDSAVTESKIGALAVTAGKIGALAVTSAKIAANAVTFGKLDSVLQGKVNRIIHELATGTVSDGTAIISSFAPVAFTINSLKVAVDSGSCTISVEINGIPVTGMSGLSITTTPLTATATALNSVAVDDEVTLVISNNSSALGFGLTLSSEEV